METTSSFNFFDRIYTPNLRVNEVHKVSVKRPHRTCGIDVLYHAVLDLYNQTERYYFSVYDLF